MLESLAPTITNAMMVIIHVGTMISYQCQLSGLATLFIDIDSQSTCIYSTYHLQVNHTLSLSVHTTRQHQSLSLTATLQQTITAPSNE